MLNRCGYFLGYFLTYHMVTLVTMLCGPTVRSMCAVHGAVMSVCCTAVDGLVYNYVELQI